MKQGVSVLFHNNNSVDYATNKTSTMVHLEHITKKNFEFAYKKRIIINCNIEKELMWLSSSIN
jgi:hypothetical protein